MNGQLSLLDIVKDKKDIDILTPECWDCYDTCVHFTNKFQNGSRDTFFDGSPRCVYHLLIKGYGTSGKDIRSKVIDNIWHSWCVLYEPRDKK